MKILIIILMLLTVLIVIGVIGLTVKLWKVEKRFEIKHELQRRFNVFLMKESLHFNK